MANEVLESVSVNIAGRSYPLKVEEHEIEIIEEVVKGINSKVREFQRVYSGKDVQDCLAMALLTYVVDIEKLNTQAPDEELTEKVKALNTLVDRML